MLTYDNQAGGLREEEGENEKEQDGVVRLRKRKIVKKVKEDDREGDCDNQKQDAVVYGHCGLEVALV